MRPRSLARLTVRLAMAMAMACLTLGCGGYSYVYRTPIERPLEGIAQVRVRVEAHTLPNQPT